MLYAVCDSATIGRLVESTAASSCAALLIALFQLDAMHPRTKGDDKHDRVLAQRVVSGAPGGLCGVARGWRP
jgi:hypothetical protein